MDIGISLSGVKGVEMAVNTWTGDREAIDRDTLVLPDVQIDRDDLSVEQVATALRPAFDVAWQAAGWEKSLNYDDAGNWTGQRPRY